MNVFRDLELRGTHEDLMHFLVELSQQDTGWERNTKREQQLNRAHSSGGAMHFAFNTPQDSDLPPATLFFYGDTTTGSLRVNNIVPRKNGQLSKEQYNDILCSFYETFIKSQASTYQIEVNLTEATRTAQSSLSERNAQLLRSFCHLANMSTGSSHPLDRRRWCSFISESFKSDEILDGNILVGLLVDEDWHEDGAHELVCEYEFAMDILKNFTGQEK